MGTTQTLQFGKCILEQKDILASIIPYQSLNLPIEHPPNCHLDGSIKKDKGVSHASVGVICDINFNVLLTRRNKNLPTFPCSWVFAGGKVDQGEDFEEAILREIDEETGIKITKSTNNSFDYKGKQCTIEPILLYESIFPEKSSELRSQYLIIYYKVVIPYDINAIEVNFDIREVDGYVWINHEDIYKILYDDQKMSIGNGYLYNDDTKQFEKQMLTENNFIYEKGKKEHIPHGHMTAIKILHQCKQGSDDEEDN